MKIKIPVIIPVSNVKQFDAGLLLIAFRIWYYNDVSATGFDGTFKRTLLV